ncbi:hypothetical protein WJX81_007594 [Elliptochloris bilobata]|uniref:Uncharacterized protein n=1 Tax=Elliptochloris bilobata TaxID=381761 RepID=A0AAW1RYZ6_9CHLO
MSNQADLGTLAHEKLKKPEEMATHDGVASTIAQLVGVVNQGEGAPVSTSAPSGKPDEVAAAVAEARAQGEKQRDDENMDEVRSELDAAAEEPNPHLSAAKERRLEARAHREAAGDGEEAAK